MAELKDPTAPPADPAAALAEAAARISNLERLRTADAAQAVKGHRPGAEIQEDLDDAKAKLRAMHGSHEKLADRARREAKVRKVAQLAAAAEYQKIGEIFIAEEWQAEQKPVFTVPTAVQTDFHHQHYAVAGFEAELDALAAALKKGSIA
jgi:hypothetical protein